MGAINDESGSWVLTFCSGDMRTEPKLRSVHDKFHCRLGAVKVALETYIIQQLHISMLISSIAKYPLNICDIL